MEKKYPPPILDRLPFLSKSVVRTRSNIFKVTLPSVDVWMIPLSRTALNHGTTVISIGVPSTNSNCHRFRRSLLYTIGIIETPLFLRYTP